MKTIKTFWLSLTIFLLLINCSSNHESINPEAEDLNSQDMNDTNIPMKSLVDLGAVAKAGYPKTIKKFENGILSYWAQYYFRPDGNILKVNYGYSSTTSEIFTYNYQYDAKGKIKKMIGWDVFDYYWENDKIIKVEGYNAAWYGRYAFFYNYNNQGQIIQKLEVYYNTTPIFRQKLAYTYLNDGNLSSIELYVDSNGSDTFELYTKTNFSEYIDTRNLFLELEIIPGQIELLQFPGTKEFKHFKSSGYDIFEIYNYKYNTEGRVIEKLYGKNKIVYDYY